jgi:hypothetical protein
MTIGDREHVEGVKICCKGDTEICPLSIYEPHAVPRILLNQEKYRVPVGDAIGIPLVMAALPPSRAWRGRKVSGGGDVMDNAPALDINPLLVSDFSDGKPGSAFVARVDGKKLHKAHVHGPVLQYFPERPIQH